MEDKEQFDAGDTVSVQKRKTKKELKREQEIAEFKSILSTKPGRALMWRILSICGVYKTSFTGNSTTFFNEGKRAVGLEILTEIFKSDPNAYGLMRIEANEMEKD